MKKLLTILLLFVSTSLFAKPLTEWQIFTLALIEVECGGEFKAVSEKQAVGPFQITKIYVTEINRIYNTNYTLQDAYSFELAYEMFMLMNQYYNSTFDIDKAIKLHNPGAGEWYAKKIKKQMEKIRLNEEIRKIISDET